MGAAAELATTVSSTVSEVRSTLSGIATSVVFIRTGPIVIPFPVLPLWSSKSRIATAPQLTLAERTDRVSSIVVAPHKLVMPQTNFELPISLVDLEARGLVTSAMAYYNSNTWGAYVDGLGATHYVFDPIQGWPSPGFSLGFGRIVIYNGYYDPGLGDTVYMFMLVAPNGTRHFLGTGTSSGANTLKTTDGSHITYAGNALGGTVYYQDGTKLTIGLVNNRRLCTQVTDTNGNYIQIAYK